jgi:hypothetical protein
MADPIRGGTAQECSESARAEKQEEKGRHDGRVAVQFGPVEEGLPVGAPCRREEPCTVKGLIGGQPTAEARVTLSSQSRSQEAEPDLGHPSGDRTL